jgi:hypothetical protein
MANLTEEQKNEVINFIEINLPEAVEIKIENGVKTGFVSDESINIIYQSYAFRCWLLCARFEELKNRILLNLPFIGKLIDKNKIPANVIQQRLSDIKTSDSRKRCTTLLAL